jgi:hypothetical protein
MRRPHRAHAIAGLALSLGLRLGVSGAIAITILPRVFGQLEDAERNLVTCEAGSTSSSDDCVDQLQVQIDALLAALTSDSGDQ